MDLHMYLCRATKKKIEDLNRIKEVENDLNKMWGPIIANELPKNHPWEYSKMTEQQRKLIDEWHNEFDIIEKRRIAIHNKLTVITDSSEKHTDNSVWCWTKFNILHEYIADNFANGVDNHQEIHFTKDNAVQILNYLNHIVDVLTQLHRVVTEDGNYYYYTCQVPDDIKLPLRLIPMNGCFFGKISVYNFFVHEITKSIDIFSMIVREWNDDYLVWYSALW